MIALPDLGAYPEIDFARFDWLRKAGVPVETLIALMPIRAATGIVADDGYFEDDPEGEPFIVFEEPEDVVFWQPRSGKLAWWNGRAVALGEDNIINATTYAFDKYLAIHAGALDWLRDRCRGIVVLDWERAFDRLRDAPRVAVAEELLPLYRRHMKPRRLPELAVLTAERRLAA